MHENTIFLRTNHCLLIGHVVWFLTDPNVSQHVYLVFTRGFGIKTDSSYEESFYFVYVHCYNMILLSRYMLLVTVYLVLMSVDTHPCYFDALLCSGN